jgi:hypothetical protein
VATHESHKLEIGGSNPSPATSFNAAIVYRLGHRVFIPVSGVRLPVAVPNLQESNMAVKKANPMTTRTGKPRLGPLNLTQLQALLEKSSKKKDKAKIRNRIAVVEARK